MHIRKKHIGGSAYYEIVEEVTFSTGTEHRVVASLGTEADPEAVRRQRHANLLSLERALHRVEPLRATDPQIARKCDSLQHHIDREKEKISQLTSAIESLHEPISESDVRAGEQSNIRELRLVSSDPAAAKQSDSGE